MSIKLEIINPLVYPHWDALVRDNPLCSVFHSSYWARVLCETYGYVPLYFTSFSNGEIDSLVPIMEIKGLLTGRRGVSLPFTDYCDPVLPGRSSFQKIMHYLKEYGGRAGWESIELRNGTSSRLDREPSQFYYRHVLDLSEGEEALFSRLRDSTGRNIKKALREGVTVRVCTSAEAVAEFYYLHTLTRKKHGLPPQPRAFFNKIHEHIIARDRGFVVLAQYKGTRIAGAVFFHLGDRAVYKYGASNAAFHYLRANNLVIWEAIRHYVQRGARHFCFGRTEPGNKGLLQFKAGWGTEEQMITYYKYSMKKKSFVREPSRKMGIYTGMFKALPVSFLKATGSLFYRYMG